MTYRDDANGPYIVWENYGYEGWKPKSFDNVKTALEDHRFCSEFVITKKVNYTVNENE